MKEKISVAILFGFSLIAILVVWIFYKNLTFEIPLPSISFSPISHYFPLQIKEVKTFSSEEEFKNYLAKAEEKGLYAKERLEFFEMPVISVPAPVPAPEISQTPPLPERVSATTVQVPGIDEPDIVKTDGKEIYFSLSRFFPILRLPLVVEEPLEKEIQIPVPSEGKTKIIKAFPPSDLALDSEIKNSGQLLLVKDKNILVIFSKKEILGYDVSNPKEPKKKWEIKLDEKNSIVTSRLHKNKIYLVTRNLIEKFHPCPIRPLIIGEKSLEIKCSEIYHPVVPVPSDVTFLVMTINPVSGEIEKKLSFVGSSGQSIVYMTDKALYITYSYYESILKFFSQFLKEKCDDLFPSWVLEKVKKLEDYDISEQAKLLELRLILENFQNALANDERLKIRNEVFNRMSNYYKENIRKFEKSGIVKIDLEKLEIKATGNIPGFPLNQFSLDEKDDILRIAVTVGERFPFEMVFYFGVSTRETANDVYVLDKNLKILGQIQDLGLGERIYSARFIEDKGYLVTFRETDPFFVLDLSDPKNPTLKGQLKIPGYSSYLHPISKDKILGIGREDWKVKISLFDVSVPENPKELAKYILDESWSDILSTHHAFLLDTKHEIFFLPGTQGGYIFSFQNDNLVLKKAVSGISAKRAIYIDDYLYIIGENKIVVLDEIGWQKIQELEF